MATHNSIIVTFKEGDFESFRKLLEKGNVDINLRNNEGSTALINAAADGHHQCVDLLIKANADINLKDKYGRTALMRAARNGRHECIKLLKTRERLLKTRARILKFIKYAKRVGQLKVILINETKNLTHSKKKKYQKIKI